MRRGNLQVMSATSTVVTTRSAASRPRRSGTRGSDPLALLRLDAEFFESLRKDLLGRPGFEGMYVAVHHREMVGSDRDELALFKEVTAKLGDVPLFIGRVERNSRIKRTTSPRFFRRAP